jgi:hypothetical protein
MIKYEGGRQNVCLQMVTIISFLLQDDLQFIILIPLDNKSKANRILENLNTKIS